jgi:hypothetical protein
VKILNKSQVLILAHKYVKKNNLLNKNLQLLIFLTIKKEIKHSKMMKKIKN